MEKEKVKLKGVNETLFVPLYARALESRKKDPLFYDETAVNVMEMLDYDFQKHGGSKMNMWGCAARTKILDNQTAAHIEKTRIVVLSTWPAVWMTGSIGWITEKFTGIMWISWM